MEEKIKKRFLDTAVQIYKSLEVIKFPHSASEIKRQLIRASSSAAANYRAVCRAKSSADFINKLKIVEEETDESMFWLEFLKEVGVQLDQSEEIYNELNELLSIIVSSIKTTRNRMNPKSNES